jgi:predicted nucleic acid-binding Zn ribbon protein
MGKNKKTMTALKDVIAGLLKSSTLPFDLNDAKIWEVWDDAVGPAIARNAQPLRIKNRLLKVRAYDPIWFQELQFMEESIREKLNQCLGRQAVDRIEFSVGPRLKGR